MTFNEYLDTHGLTPENTTVFEHAQLQSAYNAGFEEAGGKAYKELLRENGWLKQQIEKMKCCGNCKHFNFNEPNYCHKGVFRERQYVCSQWELAE